jgi:thiazole/oxazole-forming peptide maturase SagD family component
MRLEHASTDLVLRPTTRRLLDACYSPLCGLSRRIGFFRRSPGDPLVLTAGGDLTGVHVLRGAPAPKDGAYHIGGSGLFYEEVLVRVLGETVERYSQLIAGPILRSRSRFCSLGALDNPGVDAAQLGMFSDQQHANPRFPFARYEAHHDLSWIEGRSLTTSTIRWLPAQLAVVGWVRGHSEPFIAPGMSTGTAVHKTRERALAGALLELVQVDAAIGHWYSNDIAPRIKIGGSRTKSFERLLQNAFRRTRVDPDFYFLRSPDLPGIAAACVLRSDDFPARAVGLGIAFDLETALYRSLLEACGVRQLAKVVGIDVTGSLAADAFFDLDRNVFWYAQPDNAHQIDSKFQGEVDIADLPPDSREGATHIVREIIDAARTADIQLYEVGLPISEARVLGLSAARVWSPNLLAVPLPSAPPLAHPRFRRYGKLDGWKAHPYP